MEKKETRFLRDSSSSSQLYRICFFSLKHQKNYSSAWDCWNTQNIVLRKMQEHFIKIPPLKKILENFKPFIKNL